MIGSAAQTLVFATACCHASFQRPAFDIRTALGEPGMNADWADKNRIPATPQHTIVLICVHPHLSRYPPIDES